MSHKTLTRSGYILHKKFLTALELSKIQKDLIVTPKVLPAFKEFAKPKSYKTFLESPEKLFLPRYYGIEKYGDPLNSNITDGRDIQIVVSMNLRPHQLPAANAIKAQLTAGHGGVLSLPCGYGKT